MSGCGTCSSSWLATTRRPRAGTSITKQASVLMDNPHTYAVTTPYLTIPSAAPMMIATGGLTPNQYPPT